MASQDFTPAQEQESRFDINYQICAVSSQLRAADALLNNIEGYGGRTDYGIAMVDVSYILAEVLSALGRIHNQVDSQGARLSKMEKERKEVTTQ
jgi:hypothetical protein